MFGKSTRIEQEALIQAGYRYACALSSDSQDAEDLVHDAWIRVVNRYGPMPEKALLFRTVRNLFIDRYRRAQRLRLVEFKEDEVAAAVDSNPDRMSQDVDQDKLAASLHRLRDVEREALFLSVIEGYTAEEISKLTQSPRGTCLSHVHRAKLKLRKWLSDPENPPVPVNTATKRARP